MNDEAAVHYIPSIDQMTWGHRRLVDAFGECGRPRVAWQIDPFGHSREQASLWAQMYFDGLFLGRIDYNDKTKREIDKKMEFLWHGSDDLGSKADLFTGVLPNGYSPPSGFNFELLTNDDPIVDDPSSPENNVNAKVDAFIQAAHSQATNYATNHIVMTMGEDFHYQAADTWFKNLDILIRKVNERGSDVNVFYSTPSCYLQALNRANQTWSTKSDDFFPYSNDPHAFWTGYFTSRPAFKYFERRSNNYLQVVKQLQSLASRSGDEQEAAVVELKEAMGINQHHDAITGTQKQHVANDYQLLLAKAVTNCESVINDALAKLQPLQSSSPTVQQTFCHTLNVSECSIVETANKIAVTLYNPRSHSITTRVRLPVLNGTDYSVSCPRGEPVNSELVDIPEYVRTIPERRSDATRELLFEANLPALGFSTYFVEKQTHETSHETNSNLVDAASLSGDADGIVQFPAKTFSVLFDSQTGALKEVKLANGNRVSVEQDFRWYRAMRGNNSKPEFRASGAYIFRPNGTAPTKLADQPRSTFASGSTVNSVFQEWAPWLHQTINVYPQDDLIEFDWVVGPIPVDDSIGKEIVSYFTTNLTTASTFYTDANGRQLLKRVRDYRPTWPYTVIEPVSGNYYPVSSRIILRDEQAKQQLSILTDRSQGGTSMLDGQVELMVHRRALDDDAFGVGEPLNEPGFDGKGLVIRGKHVLLLNSFDDGYKHRELAQSIALAPLTTFATYNDATQYRAAYNTEFSGLLRELPPNVELLTLEKWKDDTILLRLEHFYESNDDPNNLSKPVKVSLAKLFEPFGVAAALETTLSATQLLMEARRLQWKNVGDAANSPSHRDSFSPLKASNDFSVHLKPMQIRTFVLVLRNRF